MQLSREFVGVKSRFCVLFFVMGGLRVLMFFWESSLLGHWTNGIPNSLSFEVRFVVIIVNVVLFATITTLPNKV
jgi:hypothetical protein